MVTLATGNTFVNNAANGNQYIGFSDTTTGSASSGTGNGYQGISCGGDHMGGSNPRGLCQPGDDD